MRVGADEKQAAQESGETEDEALLRLSEKKALQNKAKKKVAVSPFYFPAFITVGGRTFRRVKRHG